MRHRPPARSRLTRLAGAVLLLGCALAVPAGAQEKASGRADKTEKAAGKAAGKEAEKPAAPTDPNRGSAPPYEAELLRLAEMLGALHYIRPLCGAPDAGRWREEMQGLLDAEQPSEDRRGFITAAFNRGYESYRQVYRSCTPSAELAAQRYLAAGARLSRDIAARYGSN